MATLSNVQLISLVTLAMILAGSLSIEFSETNTFYCQSEDSVRECQSLSLTNRTCYYFNSLNNLTYKDLCHDGIWEPISNYLANKTESTLNRTNLFSEKSFEELDFSKPIYASNEYGDKFILYIQK